MALLTAGWPLVDTAVANRQPLAAGSRLAIGSGAGNSAVFTVGRGWSLAPEQSDPNQGYLLRRSAVEVSILRVNLVNRSQAQHLWAGLRQILAVSSAGVRVGRVMYVRAPGGILRSTGVIATAQKVGTATIALAPSRQFAVVILVLAPRGTRLAMRAAGARIVRSLRFTAVRR